MATASSVGSTVVGCGRVPIRSRDARLPKNSGTSGAARARSARHRKAFRRSWQDFHDGIWPSRNFASATCLLGGKGFALRRDRARAFVLVIGRKADPEGSLTSFNMRVKKLGSISSCARLMMPTLAKFVSRIISRADANWRRAIRACCPAQPISAFGASRAQRRCAAFHHRSAVGPNGHPCRVSIPNARDREP